MATGNEKAFSMGTVVLENPLCPYDQAPSIRYGSYGDSQRYLCKACGRKFTGTDTFFHAHHDRGLIAQVMTYYFSGASMQKVTDLARDVSGRDLSKAQVYRWLVKYSKLAAAWAATLKPSLGDVWVGDETVLKVGGNPRDRSRSWQNPDWWFWDLIDKKTHFLIASHFTRTRKREHAIKFLTQARDVAGFCPSLILTDKLNIYPKAVETVFGAGTKHGQSAGFGSDTNIQIIGRFHGTLKQRTKVMQWFKRAESAAAIMAGFVVHYNFFGRHESLKGKTPAHVAGVSEGVWNWCSLLEQATPTCAGGQGGLGCLKNLVNEGEWVR